MDNENVVPVPEVIVAPTPVMLPDVPKDYRSGSLLGMVNTIIMNMVGEFNIQDIINKYNEECLKLQKKPGNQLRNSRLVVTVLIKRGSIVKVSKGRWKRV